MRPSSLLLVCPKWGLNFVPESSCTAEAGPLCGLVRLAFVVANPEKRAILSRREDWDGTMASEIRCLLEQNRQRGKKERLSSMSSPGLFVPTYGQPAKSSSGSSSSSRVLPSKITTAAGVTKRTRLPALVFNGRVEYVQVRRR